jgi:hypothetical protein
VPAQKSTHHTGRRYLRASIEKKSGQRRWCIRQTKKKRREKVNPLYENMGVETRIPFFDPVQRSRKRRDSSNTTMASHEETHSHTR